MEDRSKRTETVRPHHDEHFESQLVCDSALNAKSDGDDIELNGETDDGDVEDGETGFDDRSAQVRNIRDPGQLTASEHTQHMTTDRRFRSWREFCVMGRGVNSPHRKCSNDLEGVPPMCRWIMGSLVRKNLKNR